MRLFHLNLAWRLIMTVIDSDLLTCIKSHEGCKPYAYQDSLGYWTIGVGRLIDERKGGHLLDDEIELLLTNDLRECIHELSPYSWFQSLDEVRQGVLIELCFNMGMPHLLEFVEMIEALENHDYIGAQKDLNNSVWAIEVGPIRTKNLCHRLLTGTYS